jgi:hypothetical protein
MAFTGQPLNPLFFTALVPGKPSEEPHASLRDIIPSILEPPSKSRSDSGMALFEASNVIYFPGANGLNCFANGH